MAPLLLLLQIGLFVAIRAAATSVLTSALSSDSLQTVGERRLARSLTITLAIQFDKFPDTNYWDLLTEDSTRLIGFTNQGAYNASQSQERVHQSFSVVEGQSYRFTMYDGHGNGFTKPSGFYFMMVGTQLLPDRSNIIFLESKFVGARKETIFTAEMPLTPAPTPAQPTISPAPTSAPSSCTVKSQRGFSNAYTSTPKLMNSATIFSTDALCTRHGDYASCTNEVGEDCQWIFLTSSTRKGKCRVDPVTKCLQTGNCVCYTHDFQGGTEHFGNGIVFHAPISITPRDISKYAGFMTYKEMYTQPTEAQQNPLHPMDDNFFISKVDFTARKLEYTFDNRSPVLLDIAKHSFAFKLHFLYMDTPLKGAIWNGIGLSVYIDTSGDSPTLTINGMAYSLPSLKKWTCTQFVITSRTIFVAGIAIDRNLANERYLLRSSNLLTLGKFSGELFDVRIYSGSLDYLEIREIGARCTNPDDPAVLKDTRDIDILFKREGCESTHDLYFPSPTTGGHTYGSGPFSTFWVRPKADLIDPTVWLDIPEGEFDVERYFQQKKLLSYLWEKFYFENDMIALNLKPYRYFNSEEEITKFARSTWKNPCRYMHQSNNQWDYPVYGEGTFPKWTVEKNADSLDDVFDLASIFRKKYFPGYDLVIHEVFHEFQQTLYETYSSQPTLWLLESTASFAPVYTFPAMNDNIWAGFPMAPAYPLGYYSEDPDVVAANHHFHTVELSINDRVRGGHIYSSWRLWWFLAEYAEIPHVLGKMWSLERLYRGEWNGMLSVLRLFVEAENMDLGDVWGVFLAHHRTWDFVDIGVDMAAQEEIDFQKLKASKYNENTITADLTLEKRKTTVEINPSFGTNGEFVAGPSEQRPGPFGWNCLTARGVAENKVVAIRIRWDDGMGFQPDTFPASLPNQQSGCDNDARFYNNMIVAHNVATGRRRYWKVKGKNPSTIFLNTGSLGPVTIHVILVPTPPTDYVGARNVAQNRGIKQIPIYSYKYSVAILDTLPTDAMYTAPAAKRSDGIVAFATPAPGWWPVRCTCMFDPSFTFQGMNVCVTPTFQSIAPISPTAVPRSPGGFCFSGETTVEVKGKGEVLMANLKLGDQVLTPSGNFEAVYSFGHRKQDTEAMFVRFAPSNLEMSMDHMLKLRGRYVPASAVEVGNRLETGSGDMVTVESIEFVKREGVYAPFTMSGTLVVNNVKVSSYVAFQDSDRLVLGSWTTPLSYQWLAHIAQGPHRMWVQMFGISEEKYTVRGISTWIHIPHELAKWYLRQNTLVMMLLLIPVLVVLLLISSVETVLVAMAY